MLKIKLLTLNNLFDAQQRSAMVNELAVFLEKIEKYSDDMAYDAAKDYVEEMMFEFEDLLLDGDEAAVKARLKYYNSSEVVDKELITKCIKFPKSHGQEILNDRIILNSIKTKKNAMGIQQILRFNEMLIADVKGIGYNTKMLNRQISRLIAGESNNAEEVLVEMLNNKEAISKKEAKANKQNYFEKTFSDVFAKRIEEFMDVAPLPCSNLDVIEKNRKALKFYKYCSENHKNIMFKTPYFHYVRSRLMSDRRDYEMLNTLEDPIFFQVMKKGVEINKDVVFEADNCLREKEEVTNKRILEEEKRIQAMDERKSRLEAKRQERYEMRRGFKADIKEAKDKAEVKAGVKAKPEVEVKVKRRRSPMRPTLNMRPEFSRPKM